LPTTQLAASYYLSNGIFRVWTFACPRTESTLVLHQALTFYFVRRQLARVYRIEFERNQSMATRKRKTEETTQKLAVPAVAAVGRAMKRNSSSASAAATPDHLTASDDPNYGDMRFVRRNIEDVYDKTPAEFWRYARAIERMKEGAAKRANTDWWNICSIHGGGFSKEVENEIKPLMKAYASAYATVNGVKYALRKLTRIGLTWGFVHMATQRF
jgi:hypothetical protein